VPPAKGPRRRRKRQWYFVTVETLRGLATLALLLAVGTGGFVAFRSWQAQVHEHEAAALIEQAGDLLQRLRNEARADAYREQYRAAYHSFEQAQGEFDSRDFAAARASARRAINVLRTIQEALAGPGAGGEAHFVALQGAVEVRRGAAGGWEEARNRMALSQGDFVRTSGGGSAEIMFADGALYTVRPNTQFVVSPTPVADGGRREQAIRMEYGWVDLSTAKSSSRVKTPAAEARVAEDSEAFVAYERSSRRGRFGAVRGTLELSAGRERRQVRELQQVVQTGGRFSAPRPLPDRPDAIAPADDLELELGKVERLGLAWRPIPGAVRYALQVSRNRLFTDNVIDVANRAKTTATLGVRGPGSFEWRVAAVGRDGAQGPWSAPRSFRVSAVQASGRGERSDTTPPRLELADVQPYGNIVIVEGTTEPGAQVLINGEPVKVEADGSFTKTVQLTKEGRSIIELRARDAAGNEAVLKRPVFVENT
jgi:hypothetical protein